MIAKAERDLKISQSNEAIKLQENIRQVSNQYQISMMNQGHSQIFSAE